ncbi:uncharacterized protein BDV17DRAFT_262609 [Aspergillus undulatus]|uniref:uncharacterized protein n=1 Tax=Aspergillus undulatus TaxID=1810928 RepID=UPI003CCE0EF3
MRSPYGSTKILPRPWSAPNGCAISTMTRYRICSGWPCHRGRWMRLHVFGSTSNTKSSRLLERLQTEMTLGFDHLDACSTGNIGVLFLYSGTGLSPLITKGTRVIYQFLDKRGFSSAECVKKNLGLEVFSLDVPYFESLNHITQEMQDI